MTRREALERVATAARDYLAALDVRPSRDLPPRGILRQRLRDALRQLDEAR